MTLDELYRKVKNAKYPIYTREELRMAVMDLKVEFEKDVFDEVDISTMITEYPIKTPSHLIEIFIRAAQEEYQDEEIAKEMAKDLE